VKVVDNLKRRIVTRLLEWFHDNRRAFPWRETFDAPNPYVILFTEIMLQRTKAEQVVPVYAEFFQRYPTFKELSRAKPRDVETLFQKLGLRWRARNVVKLIRALQTDFRGIVPNDFDELRELPAVGDYVAKAVLCYAFEKRVAPIDTNVVRVISRLFGLSITSDSARRNRRISEIADSLIPTHRARDFNLCLLDFAAIICRPKPMCSVCPVSRDCSYYHNVFPTN
jgi:A/G-specific adenine glycosylase